MRHRFVFLAAVAVAAVGSVVGCGDDKAPPKQAVFWLGLGPGGGMTCSSTRNYQFPAEARATITSTTAEGERIEDDADNLVDCDVRLARGSTTDFNVSLRYSGVEVGNFSANGTLTAEGGELDIDFNTGMFALEQENCVATVKTLRAGAVWISGLRCQSLRDPSSPSIQCDGQGGLIFENCDR
ncbi:MAG: hypothetical protein RL685_6388 [Pseudomonadota bacterium]